MMSMLDGFLCYNKVLVEESDHHKMAFTTLWRTFSYKRMPFVFTNDGSTFEKDMEFAFNKLASKSSVICFEELSVFSK